MQRSVFQEEETAIHVAVDRLLRQRGFISHLDELQTLRTLLHAPRARLFFLEADGISTLFCQMKAYALTPCIPETFLSLVNILVICCRDEECAVALGLLGGHAWIQKVLAHENKGEEEDDEAWGTLKTYAEMIANHCARVRGGFPLRTLALCPESAKASLRLPDRVSISASPSQDPNDELIVLIKPVANRMGGQCDTGFALWPAATILARFIAQNLHVFEGQRVLEVGAGLGLCGLVAGRRAKEVILTDYNITCLQQLQEHVCLNAAWRHEDEMGEMKTPQAGPVKAAQTGAPAAAAAQALFTPITCNMQVRWLDWDCLEALSATEWQVVESDGQGSGEPPDVTREEEELAKMGDDRRKQACGIAGELQTADKAAIDSDMRQGTSLSYDSFGRPRWRDAQMDVVIGSDCICDDDSARGVARLLSICLKPESGVAYILAPFPQHRYGVQALPGELAARNLRYEMEEVTNSSLLHGIFEARYMRFHLFTVRRTSGKGHGRDAEPSREEKQKDG